MQRPAFPSFCGRAMPADLMSPRGLLQGTPRFGPLDLRSVRYIGIDPASILGALAPPAPGGAFATATITITISIDIHISVVINVVIVIGIIIDTIST